MAEFSIYKAISIIPHNNSVDKDGRPAPFRMAVNHFTDMTEEEFAEERLIKGGAQPKVSRERRKRLKSIRQLDRDGRPIPEQVDDAVLDERSQDEFNGPLPSRKNWFEEGLVTRPIDQGSCGACWAFSAASMLESFAMITETEPAGSLQHYSV